TFLLPQQEIGIFLENQQRLTQLTEERDRAFSDLTHELRTPLTSIALVAETLSKRLHPPEVNWVERMLNETNRLIDLIQNWLDLSQLHANPSQYLNYQNFSLRDLISAVWYNLQPLAEKKQIKLIITGVEQVEILADKSRLTQVFANILDNGIKHSPQASPITLHLSLGGSDSQAKSLVICDIIDSGEGFLEADLPYVFNRLYRGDTSRKRNSNSFHTLAQGSGLGLSIAQEIIQAHGGKIIARNHPQTKGAWLQIILPLQPNHVTPPVKKTQKR
ncbi:MAG: sensor histidine kinase, partial [Cyanobacteria bacterium J083]